MGRLNLQLSLIEVQVEVYLVSDAQAVEGRRAFADKVSARQYAMRLASGGVATAVWRVHVDGPPIEDEYETRQYVCRLLNRRQWAEIADVVERYEVARVDGEDIYQVRKLKIA